MMEPDIACFPPRHRRLSSAVCTVAALGLATTLAAAEPEMALPSAAEILDGYIAASGGVDAYRKLENRVSRAKLEFVGQGIEAEVTLYAARPDRSYTIVESPAFGRIEKGTDGDLAWELNAITGPQIKEGEERLVMLRGGDFDAILHWRDLFASVELQGIETIAGAPCYKLLLSPPEGSPETRYYELESKLLRKTEIRLELSVGTIPLEVYAEDYRRVDGILFAHRARIVSLGQERVMILASVEHNVELPADRFDPPAAIRELLQPAGGEAARER